jgi:hypothetical protein
MARAEVGAVRQGLLDGGRDLRVVVPEQQGAVAAVVIDGAIAIDVPFVGAVGPLDVDPVGPE